MIGGNIMYDLMITLQGNEVLSATCITLDAIVEIVKMYQCSPSLHIIIRKVIESQPYKNRRDW